MHGEVNVTRCSERLALSLAREKAREGLQVLISGVVGLLSLESKSRNQDLLLPTFKQDGKRFQERDASS